MSGYKRAKSENKTESDQILSRAMQVDMPKVLQRRFNIAPMMESAKGAGITKDSKYL